MFLMAVQVGDQLGSPFADGGMIRTSVALPMLIDRAYADASGLIAALGETTYRAWLGQEFWALRTGG